MSTVDSFGSKGKLNVAGTEYEIFRLNSVEGAENLPFSLKVLLENLLRTEDGANITADHVRALAGWDPDAQPDTEIQFTPARVIMQDFTGVPCVVDLATMREAVKELGGDPKRVNPWLLRKWSLTTPCRSTLSATPAHWSATWRSNTSGTASVTNSSAGARRPSTTSRLFPGNRHCAPGQH